MKISKEIEDHYRSGLEAERLASGRGQGDRPGAKQPMRHGHLHEFDGRTLSSCVENAIQSPSGT